MVAAGVELVKFNFKSRKCGTDFLGFGKSPLILLDSRSFYKLADVKGRGVRRKGEGKRTASQKRNISAGSPNAMQMLPGKCI